MSTAERVDIEISRVLTQYRESPKLLHVLRTYLTHVAQVIESIDAIPTFFDINTAVGDQLTLLGKRLGWPRCHCICVTQPVFGFDCPGLPLDFPIVGFCEPGTWIDCGEFGIGDICINDDEMYRGFLKARRYQILSLYDRGSLTQAVRDIWGPRAWVVDDGKGRVVLSPGRDLSASEIAFLQLVPRVLPVAPGIQQRYHFLSSLVFGFGEGWGGFCQPTGNPVLLSDDDMSLVVDDDGTILYDLEGEGGVPQYQDADWMCEYDLRPYSCPEN